jgi:hypothetical protein
MGTNYYAKLNRCKECGRGDVIHLGKSSCGWQFFFQYNGGKFYKNIEEMKEWLKDKYIENEYGEKVNVNEFWKLVEEKKKEINNHSERYASANDFIIDGYSFTDSEFC